MRVAALLVSSLLLCLVAGEFNDRFWTHAGRSGADEMHSVVFHVASIPKALDTCDQMLMEVRKGAAASRVSV